MEVFNTPAFKAAHLARGGSPFAILTTVQQAAVYTGFDNAISALANHDGSNLNLYRTNANIDLLFDAIDYLLVSLVCPFYFIPCSFINFSFSFSLIYPMNFSGPTPCGTV
jgi:hypothetical protein